MEAIEALERATRKRYVIAISQQSRGWWDVRGWPNGLAMSRGGGMKSLAELLLVTQI